MSRIDLTANQKAVSAGVEDRTLLVHRLRDHLNLTGTHVGCDTSVAQAESCRMVKVTAQCGVAEAG